MHRLSIALTKKSNSKWRLMSTVFEDKTERRINRNVEESKWEIKKWKNQIRINQSGRKNSLFSTKWVKTPKFKVFFSSKVRVLYTIEFSFSFNLFEYSNWDKKKDEVTSNLLTN